MTILQSKMYILTVRCHEAISIETTSFKAVCTLNYIRKILYFPAPEEIYHPVALRETKSETRGPCKSRPRGGSYAVAHTEGMYDGICSGRTAPQPGTAARITLLCPALSFASDITPLLRLLLA